MRGVGMSQKTLEKQIDSRVVKIRTLSNELSSLVMNSKEHTAWEKQNPIAAIFKLNAAIHEFENTL